MRNAIFHSNVLAVVLHFLQVFAWMGQLGLNHWSIVNQMKYRLIAIGVENKHNLEL